MRLNDRFFWPCVQRTPKNMKRRRRVAVGDIYWNFSACPFPQIIQRLDLVVIRRSKRHFYAPEVKFDEWSTFGVFLGFCRV